MPNNRSKILTNALFVWIFNALFLSSAYTVAAQTACLSDKDIEQMLTRLNSQEKVELNESLLNEIIKIKVEVLEKITNNRNKKQEKNGSPSSDFTAEYTARLCEIFRQHGWLTENMVGKDGVSAVFSVLKNSTSFVFQARLVPVITAALRKNLIEKNADYASFIDRLRLQAGLKQIFGTQAKIEDGFLVLYPLLSEERVDEWRAEYKMPALKEYLRFLEINHKMPLIKSPANPVVSAPPAEKITVEKPSNTNETKELRPSAIIENPVQADEDDVIKVDTNLVNLDVIVFGADRQSVAGNLEDKDFRVFENGVEQKIAFFAKSEVPFDLVLLIDISGSTSDKTNLIRKSTRRFIEAMRPVDRLAILTFANEVNIVSPLSDDREKLLDKAKDIKGKGGSNVWDALQFTLEKVIDKKTNRRRAVVFMTDGADNALMYYKGFGSETLFADLLETVRRSETSIIPIYLDTEGNDPTSKRIYSDARKTLSLLAETSGGLFYRARKIEDLNGVYEQVLNDLSRVYSLGYIPGKAERDGTWREIKVQIPGRPELKVHTKSGYYAK